MDIGWGVEDLRRPVRLSDLRYGTWHVRCVVSAHQSYEKLAYDELAPSLSVCVLDCASRHALAAASARLRSDRGEMVVNRTDQTNGPNGSATRERRRTS